MIHQIYPYFIKFHVAFSIIFLLLAVGITAHSLVGWIAHRNYGKFENNFRKTFLIFLYLDLVLGIILYFFLKKPYEIITAEQAMQYFSIRFWAIQHFSNMIFVVILSVIGNIFIRRTEKVDKKFKYSFLYFGISTLIIIVSVGLFALRK